VACAGLSHVSSHRAVIADPTIQVATQFVRDVGRAFIVDGVTFQAHPLTARGSYVMVLPVPVPVPLRDEAVTRPGLSVGVTLKPPRKGATFDPHKVRYWETPSEPHAPIQLRGHFDCSAQTLPDERPLPAPPFALTDTHYTCMWLTFDVVPPDPRDQNRAFFVEIGGLLLDGVPHPLPVLRFEPATSTGTFALP
jgi:hypothetical protein